MEETMLPLVKSLRCLTAGLAATSVALAQNTASLSGRVLSEQGLPVRATVTLSFAAPRGYPAPPRRTLTGANGAFTFSHLAPGTYRLCVPGALGNRRSDRP
jgi:Carboxypeptidase regulatory-like domain